MASQLLRRPLLGVTRPAIFRPTNMTGSAVSLLQRPAPIQKRFKAGQSVDYPQPRAQQSMRIASAEDEVLPRDMGLAASGYTPPSNGGGGGGGIGVSAGIQWLTGLGRHICATDGGKRTVTVQRARQAVDTAEEAGGLHIQKVERVRLHHPPKQQLYSQYRALG